MEANEIKFAKELSLAKAYAKRQGHSRFGIYTVVDGNPVFYCAPDFPNRHKIGLPHLVSFVNGSEHRLEPDEVLNVMHYALHPSNNL